MTATSAATPPYIVIMVNPQSGQPAALHPFPQFGAPAAAMPSLDDAARPATPPEPLGSSQAVKVKPAKWRAQKMWEGDTSALPSPAPAIEKPRKAAKWRANQTLVEGQYHQHRIKVPKPPPPPKPKDTKKWAKQVVFSAQGQQVQLPPSKADKARAQAQQHVQQQLHANMAALQANLLMQGMLTPGALQGALGGPMGGAMAPGAAMCAAACDDAAPVYRRAGEADAAALLSLAAGWVESSSSASADQSSVSGTEDEDHADVAERSMAASDGLQQLAACSKAIR